MAFDHLLAERLRCVLTARTEIAEKKMFGGLAFMVSDHLCCGIVNDSLMARVGPAQYQESLSLPHASFMDFTGKPLKGLVYVAPAGIASDQQLVDWVERCLRFVQTLPAKR